MADSDTIEEVRPEAVPAGVVEYDMPPKVWKPGTVVPVDTDPEDMSDAEYVQWMYDNHTPFWAIRKNLAIRKAPTISGLEPSTAEIGGPTFELKVSGTDFVDGESTIVFNGQDLPTQLNEDGTVSTGISMNNWLAAAVVPVHVRNGPNASDPLEFTFTVAPGSEAERRAEAIAKADADRAAYLAEMAGTAEDNGDDDGMPAKKKARRKK